MKRFFKTFTKPWVSSAAWGVHQLGSLYHWEGDAAAPGLFGQTFSGFVDANGGFQIMYPSKKAGGIGTISLARVRHFS